MKSHVSNTSEETATTDVGSCSVRPRRGSSATGYIDHKTQCFICRRERTSKGDHKLLLVSMADRQNSIWKKAKDLQDENMLYHIHGFGDNCIDMVANDFKYHKSCLDSYLTKSQTTSTSGQHDEGVHWLTSYIDGALSHDPNDIIFLSSLRDKYRAWLSDSGASLSSSRSSSIKKKIEHYYRQHGSPIMIVPQRGQSSIICSSDMSIGYLLAKVASMKDEISAEESADESEDDSTESNGIRERNITLYLSAKSLQTDIKATASQLKKNRKENIDTSMQITFDAANERLPVSLYNHVAWLITDATPELTDPNTRVQLKEREHEKVLNLAQDISAAVANTPNPKHIGSALHVLKQTMSKEIVTMMNRFGNSISYQDAQRYITTMAQPTDEPEQDKPLIPSNLKSGLFTHCAIDNLDFHEHIPDGSTMHGTTHNIYQYPRNTDDLSSTYASVPLAKSRKASCTGIQPFHTKDSGLTLQDRQRSRSMSGVSLTHEEHATNLLSDHTVSWQLIQNDCFQTVDHDSVISWNAFHALLVEESTSQTLIGYGPFFPESPTKPDVVEASVEYCITVTQALGQQHCVLTCDQAIYEINLGLQKKKPDKYKHLILRMGGFHIASNFLGALGKLFKSSGIETLVVEAKVFLGGTMNKLMADKDYYKMVRCHTMVMSTMLELYWEAFESWTLDEPGVDLDVMASLNAAIRKLAEAAAHEDTTAALQAQAEMIAVADDVQKLLSDFENTLCNSPTAKLCIMYINMVLLLKRYIAAERKGCWEDHLTEVENMLPYLVSAGHIFFSKIFIILNLIVFTILG